MWQSGWHWPLPLGDEVVVRFAVFASGVAQTGLNPADQAAARKPDPTAAGLPRLLDRLGRVQCSVETSLVQSLDAAAVEDDTRSVKSNNLDVSIRLFDVVSYVPQKQVKYLALIGWDMLNFFQLSASLQCSQSPSPPQTIHAWCCKYQCTLGTFKAQPVYLRNQSFQNEKSSRRHQECPIRNQAGSFPAPRHICWPTRTANCIMR